VNFLGFLGLWGWSGRDGSGFGRRSGENCFEGGHIDPRSVCEGRSAGPRPVVVLPAASVHRLGGLHDALLLPAGASGHVLRVRIDRERGRQSGAHSSPAQNSLYWVLGFGQNFVLAFSFQLSIED
jgi:hypothetical protein